jgi:hypothetical protein
LPPRIIFVRIFVRIFLLALSLRAGPEALVATAQVAVDPARPGPQASARDVEPLQCWWRTSVNAVRVGEPFHVVLTCALLEAQTVAVVADEAKLDPIAIQLPPFEVLRGSRAADVRANDRRFFQYDYELRVVSDSLFGKDVPLPPLTITYRIRTRVGDGTSSEGLDRSYELPQQSVRVLSLVADEATDIRDASPATFGEVEADALRAGLLVTTGAVLMGLAGLVAIVGFVRMTTGSRVRTSADGRMVSTGAILREVARELSAVARERETAGWTPELAGRALAALRIGGTYLLVRGATQQPADPDLDTADGALLVRSALSGRRAVVSGSVTPYTIASEVARLSTRRRRSVDQIQRLDELQETLATLTRVAYGRDEEVEEAHADAALEAGQRLVQRLVREHRWIVRKLTSATKHSTGLGRRLWSR